MGDDWHNSARFATGFVPLRRGRQRSGYRNCYAKFSAALVEFALQLPLQMSPRSLFDRATFVNYSLFLGLAFPPCSWFHRLRHVADLWASRADFSLFWFCIRIHECLTPWFATKITGNAANWNIMEKAPQPN